VGVKTHIGYNQEAYDAECAPLRCSAMCLLAWMACNCPGRGSSEAIRLLAAWASVKTVTRSCIVYRLAAISSALETAGPDITIDIR
jgi:hypothetical protein